MDKNYLLNLSVKGTFRPSGEAATSPADVDAIFTELAQSGRDHLALYFHGGLVSEQSGLQNAETLLPYLHDQANTHPVFFVWESGFTETALRNLEKIRNEPIFKRLLEAVIKFALAKLAQTSDSRGIKLELPESSQVTASLEEASPLENYDSLEQRGELSELSEDEAEQFSDYLANDEVFEEQVLSIAATLGSASDSRSAMLPPGGSRTASEETMLSGAVLDQLKADMEESRGIITTTALVKMAASVLARTVLRLMNHTDHGIYCTAVEELLRELYLDNIGAWLWKGMKDTINDAFVSNDNLTGEALHGGTYFLDKLRSYLSDHPGLKVSLIGHSAGGIYICQFLAKAFAMLPANFVFNHVIMLAPACDFELFKSSVVDHSNRIRSYRLFTLLDEFEKNDAIVPVAYPRSLLYFVAGVLEGDKEKPLVGLQRCYSGVPPYDSPAMRAAQAYVNQPGAGRIVWAQAQGAPPGYNSMADGHGAFREPVTWESIVYLLQQ